MAQSSFTLTICAATTAAGGQVNMPRGKIDASDLQAVKAGDVLDAWEKSQRGRLESRAGRMVFNALFVVATTMRFDDISEAQKREPCAQAWKPSRTDA